ncbi:MAG: RNA methyltransferase [Pseudomonadota bacterium]
MAPPAIILVRPQLAENIGKAARAMLNFGLDDLRLVAPRDGWPNPEAGPAAAGADSVLDKARAFASLEEAIADCHFVYAATRRPRGMMKAVATLAHAAGEARRLAAARRRAAILFGPERAGLENDEVARAGAILTIPANSAFASLNLAQAVVLFAYEWHQAADATPSFKLDKAHSGPAAQGEVVGLIAHLEEALAARNYFFPESRAGAMRRTLRNLVSRAGFTAQEVRTLRGVVKRLDRFPRRDARKR